MIVFYPSVNLDLEEENREDIASNLDKQYLVQTPTILQTEAGVCQQSQ